MEREFMFSIVPSYKEEFLACVDVFVRLLYVYVSATH